MPQNASAIVLNGIDTTHEKSNKTANRIWVWEHKVPDAIYWPKIKSVLPSIDISKITATDWVSYLLLKRALKLVLQFIAK